LAFAHIYDGKSFTESAAAIRIKMRTLMNWIKRFKALGIHGLTDRAGRGVKPCISPEDRAVFQQKRSGGRIRGGADVLALIKEKYNVAYFEHCI
jgi:transposase